MQEQSSLLPTMSTEMFVSRRFYRNLQNTLYVLAWNMIRSNLNFVQWFCKKLAKNEAKEKFIKNKNQWLVFIYICNERRTLKLVSVIFYQFFIFHQMIARWKVFFISSKRLFSFSRYSDFCIFVFPSFFPCQSLL